MVAAVSRPARGAGVGRKERHRCGPVHPQAATASSSVSLPPALACRQLRARWRAEGTAAVDARRDAAAPRQLGQQAQRGGQVHAPRIKLPHRVVLWGGGGVQGRLAATCRRMSRAGMLQRHARSGVAHHLQQHARSHRQGHQLAGCALIPKVGHRPPHIQQQQQLVLGERVRRLLRAGRVGCGAWGGSGWSALGAAACAACKRKPSCRRGSSQAAAEKQQVASHSGATAQRTCGK